MKASERLKEIETEVYNMMQQCLEIDTTETELLQYYPYLINRIKRLTEVLEKICAPIPDGFGSFVADEFIEQEILDGRKVLEDET